MPVPPAFGDVFAVDFDSIATPSGGQVVQLADGRFVVGWTDYGNGSVDYNIGFRILNADGSPLTGSRIATGGMGGSQEGVSIAALAGGGFVLVWTNYLSNTTGADVSYRVYDAAGKAISKAITIETAEPQAASSVVSTASGGFIIGWQESQTNDGVAREFDSNGLALGTGPIRITDGGGFDSGPKLANDGAGYVAAWADSITGQPAGTGGIFSRSFTEFPTADYTVEGDLVSDEDLSAFGRMSDIAVSQGQTGIVWLNSVGQNTFNTIKIGNNAAALVGTGTADFVSGAQIAALPDGGFVVTWTEVLNNNPRVYGRTYDSTGVATSDPFQLKDVNARQNSSDVTAMLDGRILFTWESGEADGNYMQGRFFDPRLDPILLTGTNKANQFVGTNFANGDTIAGVGGNDTLCGASGADVVDGGSGRDSLFGGNGTDSIEGGTGRDYLRGGTGADAFVFTAQPSKNSFDHLADFSRVDIIQLDDAAFGALGAAVTVGELRFGIAAEDGNDRLIYDRATGRLWYDADGSAAGAKVLFAVIDTNIRLTFADFDMI